MINREYFNSLDPKSQELLINFINYAERTRPQREAFDQEQERLNAELTRHQQQATQFKSEIETMDLGELFAESDRIGDKYLTPEEIAERDRKLQEAINS